MKDKIKVQVIGATGYGGIGIIDLLSSHPNFQIISLLAKDKFGKTINNFYPHLNNISELMVEEVTQNAIGKDANVIIFTTPDTVAMQMIEPIYERLMKNNIKIIDFSGDFRFKNINDYEEYAQKHPKLNKFQHSAKNLLDKSVYGLPELFKDEIKDARIVGNPGCFAVSMILGIAPLNKLNLIDKTQINIDSTTGTSGAGKSLNEIQHFSNMESNFIPYRALSHQHVTEVKKVASSLGNTIENIHFVPHLINTTRGIMSSIHIELIEKTTKNKLLKIFQDYYRTDYFIRIIDNPPSLKNVRGSNYCDISIDVDEKGKHAVIFSAIDNLMKGQSSNAVQCLNIMYGLNEKTGLERAPLYP
ncbi:MAG: N-acetyl-gamma-glutamyl-phosphate reductase [Chloroflexi bacterium]|jgi:N-acetyl-gamma-glutamyl-phosphate reductase|nr:MAG: N-acetyl-gamma-glutamyl-phosphate reductase [Chloroflexota bacterium]|tara:strand:- start:12916 stop:13992 length:1077 start_codon:yes stop_codon:yes gene_type:complete